MSWNNDDKAEVAIIDGVPLEKGVILTEEYVDEHFDVITQYLDLFLKYPDLYLDMITPSYKNFNLFFYQRLLLRAFLRYRYVFGTFTRAYSKSFLAILSRILQCVFLPNTKSFVCADIKGTGVKIATEKVTEIFDIWPLLGSEVLTKHQSNDYIELFFRNGSMFDIINSGIGTRGIRRTSGILEEAVLLDGEEVNERVLPTLNISRKDCMGNMYPDEPTQSQAWITSAGPKACYAYEKLLEITVMSIIHPESAYVCGGDYRIPVKVGLMNKSYIDDMKMSSTFKEDSFAREILSIWTGASSESWINTEKLGPYRRLLKVEYQADFSRDLTNLFYYISVDVGRYGANTAITVFKCYVKDNFFQKNIVFLDVLNDEHFNLQANYIKRLIDLYMPREVVIDGNGLGAGLVDFLTIPTTDNKTGEIRPPLGVINDEDYLTKQDPSLVKVLWILKATPSDNSVIHSNCYTQLTSGHVAFLADERTIRGKILATKKGQRMSMVERAKKLKPYEATTRLFDEIANLKIKPKPNGLDVEQIRSTILKDRFSSFEYGLWRIKSFEDDYMKKKNKKKKGLGKYLAFTPKTAG